ncbi:hypothetical protein [Tabrizicola soli]|uniref:Holin n=1 Tax=Tabrizicola soli TaxID=2185115 RepID=A0ABV7DZG9_9RHOB|nr:hypothetical protein [Tabrizicola soli]
MFQTTEQTVKFWIAVSLALLAKFLLTEKPLSNKQKLASIVSGILASLFGTEYAAGYFEVVGANGFVLVAAVLAITGEHFVRALITMGPKMAEAAINAWLTGKKFIQFVNTARGPDDEK